MNVVGHRFTSAKSDDADPLQVQPSHWNDGHRFAGGAAGDVLMRDPTDPAFGAAWNAGSASQTYSGGFAATIAAGPLAHVVFLNNAVASDLHGVYPTSGTLLIGTRLHLVNIGAGMQTLIHRSGSLGSGLFRNLIASGRATRIGQWGSATYIWEGTEWGLIAHEQGQAMVMGFTNANFVGFTCTNIAVQDVYIHGRDAHIRFYAAPAVIAAEVPKLSINGWPFLIGASPTLLAVASFTAAYSGWGTNFVSPSLDGTAIDLIPQSFGTWPVSSIYISFDVTVPVT